MANDTVWQKSQRFAGITSVVCGLIMIVMGTFLPGVWNVIILTAVFIAWFTMCIIASYRYYKSYNALN